MKLKCSHGYFLFEETDAGQISSFMSLSGLSLAPVYNGYTFEDLVDAPEYSIAGKPFLGFTALETFEGRPHDVFEANGVVYDFNAGLVVPIASVTQKISLSLAGNYYISNGLILAGSLTKTGQRVKSYSAHYSRRTFRWLYSEVEYYV